MSTELDFPEATPLEKLTGLDWVNIMTHIPPLRLSYADPHTPPPPLRLSYADPHTLHSYYANQKMNFETSLVGASRSQRHLCVVQRSVVRIVFLSGADGGFHVDFCRKSLWLMHGAIRWRSFSLHLRQFFSSHSFPRFDCTDTLHRVVGRNCTSFPLFVKKKRYHILRRKRRSKPLAAGWWPRGNYNGQPHSKLECN